MRGRHEGKELELMLAGKKFLAAFGDVVPESGEIHEDIIPEEKFAPYVKDGTILRVERHFPSHYEGKDYTTKNVCFVVPGHEWRAEAYFWLRQYGEKRLFPYDDAVDIAIGRLLSYREKDIEEFIIGLPAVRGFKLARIPVNKS